MLSFEIIILKGVKKVSNMLKNNSSKTFRISLLVTIILLNFLLAVSQPQQEGEDQRDTVRLNKITPEKFSANRANPNPSPLKTTSTRKKPKSTTSPKHSSKPVETEDVQTQEEVAALGFTLWNLLPLSKDDENRIGKIQAKALTEEIDKKDVVPQRVKGNPFRVEEETPLRFSIELPVSGYLYVFDREKYADGSYSTPYLVYPIADDDNYVQAYQTRYLPRNAQKYNFTLSTKGIDNRHIEAEEYTFIVSPQALKLAPIGCSKTEDPDYPIKCDPREIKKEEFDFEAKLKEWSGKTEVDEFDLTKPEHQKYKVINEAEQAALKDKSKKLNKGAPPPQSVYTISRNPSQPYMVSIPIYITAKK